MNDLKNIAVLVDADNTPFGKLDAVFCEIAAHGRITLKRAYGNWQKANLKKWDQEIKRLAIRAEQQFDYVPRKNATDIAMVIDALKLLHTAIYDCFVLISSDSDFTPLAITLRESGVYVMGVGEKKTPESFINACDEFILLENCGESGTESAAVEKAKPAEAKPAAAEVPDRRKASGKSGGQADARKDNAEELHKLLRGAFNLYQKDNGYARLSTAGSYIKRIKPDFDIRSYGYRKLYDFLSAFPQRYRLNPRTVSGDVEVIMYQCI